MSKCINNLTSELSQNNRTSFHILIDYSHVFCFVVLCSKSEEEVCQRRSHPGAYVVPPWIQPLTDLAETQQHLWRAMSTSYQVSLKIHQTLLEKSSKIWKAYDRRWRQTDGRHPMTIAHLSLRLRSANQETTHTDRIVSWRQLGKILTIWSDHFINTSSSSCLYMSSREKEVNIIISTAITHHNQYALYVLNVTSRENASRCNYKIDFRKSYN